MADPILPIRTQMEKMYEQILDPIDILPVYKRNFKHALPTIGITLTYPVSTPAACLFTTLYYKTKGIPDNSGISSSLMFLLTPLEFPGAVKELVSPSAKGVRITNTEILSDNPVGKDYVGISSYGKFNPDFFGTSSSAYARKASLQVVFPDGLELSENGHAFYPADGNHYHSTRHFLKTDRSLIDNIYSLREREEQVWKRWRHFKQNLKPEEVSAVLRSFL